jgi:hypothetical protein
VGPSRRRDGLTSPNPSLPLSPALGRLAHGARAARIDPTDALVVAVHDAAVAAEVPPSWFGPLGERPDRPDLRAAWARALADTGGPTVDRGHPDGGEHRSLLALAWPEARPAGPTGSDDHTAGPGLAAPDAGWAPEWFGALHEALLPADLRHTRGVHYTPSAVAAALVQLALGGAGPTVLDGTDGVLDPSCGGGAFLLAAARRLHARGVEAADVLAVLHGIDLDPLAADVAVATLRAWAISAGWPGPRRGEGGEAQPAGPWVRVGDALDPAVGWTGPSGGAPGAIVGNPPFGGQLGGRTARTSAGRRQARGRLGRAAGYADTAALFLHRAAHEVAPTGVVALLQPLSFLAARDTAPVRDAIEAALVALWVGDGREFAADVHVCAPVLRPSGSATPVRPSAEPVGSVAVQRGVGVELSTVGAVPRTRLSGTALGSWAPLWATAAGVPDVELQGRACLGEWCSASAGFRDEFYALAPLVHDDPEPRPERPPAPGQLRVLTSGLVDAGGTAWGARPARLAGRRLEAPLLERAAAEASPERRLRAVVPLRARPKVVVATQSRVVEAVVDDDGRFWPSVPLITVTLRPELDDAEHRWLVAAALMAPPITAWALRTAGGTALTPSAVKLAARQVLQVPLPTDHEAWSRGAGLLRDGVGPTGEGPSPALMAEVGRELIAAHGLGGPGAAELLAWWCARLVPARAPRR